MLKNKFSLFVSHLVYASLLPQPPEQMKQQSMFNLLKQRVMDSALFFTLNLQHCSLQFFNLLFPLKSRIPSLNLNLLEMKFEYICNEILGMVYG